MHKNTKLFPDQRREIFHRWGQGDRISDLARHFRVSRPTIYETVHKGRLQIFSNYTSTNQRYRTLEYGLQHLSKTERALAKILAKREHRHKRYEKQNPGELVHFDTKQLPRIVGEGLYQPREHLHVAIDDYSRYLVADIFPDKTSYSAAIHLEEVRTAMPFVIEKVYSDNGSSYRGRADHPFVALCLRHGIAQGFTRPHRPQTNGKAERVIQTLMREWFYGTHFISREQRRRHLYAYVRWYNTVRAHQSLGGLSPVQRLETYLVRLKAKGEKV